MGDRREKAASSLVFKLFESFGAQGVSFFVSLVLARLLDPTDYGTLTKLTAFIAISQVFVQSGLNTALIQKKDVQESDLSSACWVGLGIAAVFYALLFFCAPMIADFYETAALSPMLRVLALTLFPCAMISVQTAVVARGMKFKQLMVSTLVSTVLSGAVGIGMALSGRGVWSLVGQQLCAFFGLSLFLYISIRWKPHAVFSRKRVGSLIAFGWKLLVSSLLETGYINLRLMVIGKKYSSAALAYYNRGNQFPELIMNAVNGSIQSVMMPVFSEKQDDRVQMKALAQRTLIASCFIVMPLTAGLAAVASPLVSLLLTDKWLPCVPFLQMCCIDYAFYPVHTTNLQVINALGRSDVFLKLEIIKKIYGVTILLITVFCFQSVMAIAWGGIISTLISVAVNVSPNRRFLNYGVCEQLRNIMPSFALSAVMFACVFALNALPLPTPVLLIVQVITGIAVYGGLARLFHLKGFEYALATLHGLKRKAKSKE